MDFAPRGRKSQRCALSQLDGDHDDEGQLIHTTKGRPINDDGTGFTKKDSCLTSTRPEDDNRIQGRPREIRKSQGGVAKDLLKKDSPV